MSGQYDGDCNDEGCSEGEPTKKNDPKSKAKAWVHMWFHWIQFFGILEALAISAFVIIWILTFSTNQLTNYLSLAQALHVVSLIIIIVLSFMIKNTAKWKWGWAIALIVVEGLNVAGGLFAFFSKLFWTNPSTYNPGPGADIAITANPTKVEITSFVVTCIALAVAIVQVVFSVLFYRAVNHQKKLEHPKKGNQPSENVPVSEGGAPFYPSSSHMNKKYWGGNTSYSSINALDNANFQNEPSSFNMRMQ